MVKKKTSRKNLIVTEFDPSASVGEILRSARKTQELEIEDAVDGTKLLHSYIEAMEADNFEALPGSIYRKAYVKSYANYLRLDSAKLLEKLDAIIAPAKKEEEKKEEHSASDPFPEARTPSFFVVIISLLVAVGIYGGWHYTHRTEKTLVNEQAEKRIDAFTKESHDVVIVASEVVDVAIFSMSDTDFHTVFQGKMQKGDTYFLANEDDLIFSADKPKAVEFYIDGEKVVSLDNLERKEEGYVLNINKMLAVTDIR